MNKCKNNWIERARDWSRMIHDTLEKAGGWSRIGCAADVSELGDHYRRHGWYSCKVFPSSLPASRRAEAAKPMPGVKVTVEWAAYVPSVDDPDRTPFSKSIEVSLYGELSDGTTVRLLAYNLSRRNLEMITEYAQRLVGAWEVFNSPPQTK